MKVINKIKLKNYKRFPEFEVGFSEEVNLIIGDNEAGKSSLLTAIELVISGSKSKVESLGLENLFNKQIINDFFTNGKKIESLPTLHIELFLNEQNNPNLNGKVNSDN